MRRKKFDGVKKRLQEKGLRCPAILKMVVDNNRHTFTSPEESGDFLSRAS